MSTTFFQNWSRFTDSWVNFKTFNATYAKKGFTDTYDIHIQSVRQTVECRKFGPTFYVLYLLLLILNIQIRNEENDCTTTSRAVSFLMMLSARTADLFPQRDDLEMMTYAAATLDLIVFLQMQ